MLEQKTRVCLKDFTNIYSLNKTLRFRLIPEPKTKEFLYKEILAEDRKIAKNYKEIKTLLNEIHQEFICDAMANFSFDRNDIEKFEEIYLTFLSAQKDRDNLKKGNQAKNAFEKEQKKLTKIIANHFAKFKWDKHLSDFTKKKILGKDVLKLLQEKYKDDVDKQEIVEVFNNFSTYLTGFNENRASFYKGENKAGQFATRTIDNLVQFLKNKKLFEDVYKEKYSNIGISREQKSIFQIDHFNVLFLQKGIDDYNGIIGGVKGRENKTNEGINEKINKYKQRLSKKDRRQFAIFTELYKQIGSTEKAEEKFIEIDSDEMLVEELTQFPDAVDKFIKDVRSFYEITLPKIQNEELDLEKIYLPKSIGTYFSHLVFSDWSKLAYVYNKRYLDKNVKIDENGESNVQYVSLALLKKRFEEVMADLKINAIYEKKIELNAGVEAEDLWQNFWKVVAYHIDTQFSGGVKQVLDKEKNEYVEEMINDLSTLQSKYLEAVKQYKDKMIGEEPVGLTDEEENNIKENIKNYLDQIKEIERIAQYFDLKKFFENIDEKDKDLEFYFEYGVLLNGVEETRIRKYYDEFRNYLTKINLVEKKIKLNFNSGLLLDGWDLNKEKEKFSVIFKNDQKYYLGVLNKKSKDVLDKNIYPEIFQGVGMEKMEYKLFPSPSKMLPKIAFTKYNNGPKKGQRTKPVFLEEMAGDEISDIKKEFADFQEIKKADKEKWSDEFDREKLNKLIDYYKLVLEKHPENYMATYNFQFKKSSDYKNLGEFNDDVAKQNYFIKFLNIDKNYINSKVESGELYLFQIYNKDFSDKHNGKENLETIYFKELFSEENLKDPVFKLSGGAEIFFRDALKKKKQKKKKDNKGNKILDKRRFAQDTILFHVPIEINYGKQSINQGQFNKEVNQFIADNSDDVNIIGIDRGEKHLLYYYVMDSKGNKIESGSLNKVHINGKDVDFHEKLDKAEKERQKSRQSWQKIEEIKNLKKGYISHVIHKVVNLAVEHNAIIILEDLNFGFKSFRQKIEKNVYQQFEKALIDKLGFVTNKEKQDHRKALQLSAPFESFEKMGKQTGIIYYVLAANTSKVCPVCHWRKNFYPSYRGKETLAKLHQGKEKLCLFYEKDNDRFHFDYKAEGKNEQVFSDVDRVRYDKTANNNRGGFIEYKNGNDKCGVLDGVEQERALTFQLKDLFEDNDVDFKQEIIGQIIDQKDEVKYDNSGYVDFQKRLFYLLNLILNIRNSITQIGEDRIQCPACHFDSSSDDAFITDGDENGAYNIAMRGRYLIKNIKANPEKPKKIFKNTEYFGWVRGE